MNRSTQQNLSIKCRSHSGHFTPRSAFILKSMFSWLYWHITEVTFLMQDLLLKVDKCADGDASACSWHQWWKEHQVGSVYPQCVITSHVKLIWGRRLMGRHPGGASVLLITVNEWGTPAVYKLLLLGLTEEVQPRSRCEQRRQAWDLQVQLQRQPVQRQLIWVQQVSFTESNSVSAQLCFIVESCDCQNLKKK